MKKKTHKDMIGDGKLPNLYWVSLSNDYAYSHKLEEGESCIDWIGDIITSFVSKGETIEKPFKTYKKAKSFCDELVLGHKNGYGFTVNRINIEDRLSGQLYEKTFIFDPDTAKVYEDEFEDYRFSEKRIKELGYTFA